MAESDCDKIPIREAIKVEMSNPEDINTSDEDDTPLKGSALDFLFQVAPLVNTVDGHTASIILQGMLQLINKKDMNENHHPTSRYLES